MLKKRVTVLCITLSLCLSGIPVHATTTTELEKIGKPIAAISALVAFASFLLFCGTGIVTYATPSQNAACPPDPAHNTFTTLKHANDACIALPNGLITTCTGDTCFDPASADSVPAREDTDTVHANAFTGFVVTGIATAAAVVVAGVGWAMVAYAKAYPALPMSER